LARTERLYWVLPSVAAAYARSVVRGGDLLLSIVGVYVGTVGQVPIQLEGANLTQTTARIAVAAPHSSRFFFHQFIARDFQREVSKYTKGSAQPGLNLADVERMRVVAPEPADQRRVAAVLDSSLDAIAVEEAKLLKLNQIRDGLSSDLLSGRIRTVPA
jgi:type I restriction enzyme S subunit